jgi:hypothetical protein
VYERRRKTDLGNVKGKSNSRRKKKYTDASKFTLNSNDVKLDKGKEKNQVQPRRTERKQK